MIVSRKKDVASWIPDTYQESCVQTLLKTQQKVLVLGMGGGKTAISLSAFDRLKSAGEVSRAFVVAPKKIADAVWHEEAAKFKEFQHIKVESLTSQNISAVLESSADIVITNPESLEALERTRVNVLEDFDILIIDELTRFKNPSNSSFMSLQRLTAHIKRRWGLTGTPASEGLKDVFGQALIIDGGASFGTRKTVWLREHFYRDPYTKKIVPTGVGAAVIHGKLKTLFSGFEAPEDDKPKIKAEFNYGEVSKEIFQSIQNLARDKVTSFGEVKIIAANATSVYNVIKQMSGGALYDSNTAVDGLPRRGFAGGVKFYERFEDLPNAKENKTFSTYHTAKIDMLKGLVERIGDKQILIAYYYRHELDRLREVYPQAGVLGGGSTKESDARTKKAWNAGRLKILLAHPQSAGHGLNIQHSSAYNIIWFSLPERLENYLQFRARLARRGNSAAVVYERFLFMKGFRDDERYASLIQKKSTSDSVIDLVVNFCKTSNNHKETYMSVYKLARLSEYSATETPTQEDGMAGLRKRLEQGLKDKDAEKEPPKETVQNRPSHIEESHRINSEIEDMLNTAVKDVTSGGLDLPSETAKEEAPEKYAEPEASEKYAEPEAPRKKDTRQAVRKSPPIEVGEKTARQYLESALDTLTEQLKSGDVKNLTEVVAAIAAAAKALNSL